MGRIVWNRVRMIKDLDTGRRISRANPRSEWQSVPAPALQIVDGALWGQVEARRIERGRVPATQRRAPAHPLSGLLRCGCCGSSYSVHDRDKTGKTRIRCSALRESGTCSNRRIVYLVTVEQAVLAGLTDHLSNPWLIAEYVDAYNAERQRLARTGPQELPRLQARRDVAIAELDRVKRTFIRGLINEAEAEHEMPRIRAGLQAIEEQILMIGASSEVIALEPAAVARFHRSAEDLATTLRDHARNRSGSRAGVRGPSRICERR